MKKNINKTIKSNRLIKKTALCTTLFLLLAICIIPLVSSTTPPPKIDLPGEQITMIVYDDTVAYFEIFLSGVPTHLDVEDGAYNGWCADRSVVMPRGEELTVRLFSSYDPSLPVKLQDTNWGKVNYILNHKNGATKNDLQDAFWYLLCDYPYSSLSSNAKMLVDSAQNDFIPQPSELIAIPLEPVRNSSNPWPFQIAFLQVFLPTEEQNDDEETTPDPIRHSHGLHYNDIPPVADANGPYNGFSHQEIEFDGAASYDADGIIILYHWDFGDGTSAEAKTMTHTYTHAGVYPITLTVRDNFGISDTDTTTVTIVNPNNPPSPPLISGLSNGSVNTLYPYAFGAVDQDDDELIYSIDWGDGTTAETIILPSGEYFGRPHQWTDPGTYTITVTASDGSLSATSEKDVTIHENLIVDNLWLIILALLILIILLIALRYAKKKNK